MSHLGLEALRRILGGEGGPRERESAADHLLSCDRCRLQATTLVDELRTKSPGLRREGPLQLVLDLIERERQSGVESLVAFAERTEVRRLPSRRSQRDRVRMTKACHTIAFFKLVLAELKEEPSWDEAEFLASLALLAVEAMSQRQQITQASSNDLQAEVWTAVANARRLAAEWKRADQALANAERHLKEGTGEPFLKAGLLSITASTLAEMGHESRALDALEGCRAIYQNLSEWALLGRTLVQKANILVETDPSEGLVALDHAAPLIPGEDSYLTLLAELLRARCLIELQEPTAALQVFQRSSPLLIGNPRIRLRIRGRFTCALLLDALDSKQQAERLFDDVVDRDIEHELYKDAFLDLLYLYGVHVKAGHGDKAARVCRRALTDPALSGIAHDQLRAVWTQLLETATAQKQPVSPDSLKDLRQYVNVYWKSPAPVAPEIAFRG